jgi:hypothetical protein
MIIEPLQRADWLTMIGGTGADAVTPFQHPAWLDYQAGTIAGTDASLAFRFPGGEVAAVPLLRVRRHFGRAQHWSEYGGVLTQSPLPPAHLESIYAYLARERRPVRLTVPPSARSAAWTPAAPWQSDHHTTHLLELPESYDEWFNHRVHKTCRTDVRRGEKSGLSISTEGSPRDLDAYLALYELSADRWDARGPVKRRNRESFARLLACPLTRLQIIYKADRPAAGMITLQWGTYVMYYLGASDRTLADCRPTDFGLSELVRSSIAAGKTVVNLGQSLGIASLQKFKEKYGAVKFGYRTDYMTDALTSLVRSYRYYRRRLTGR